MSLELANMKPVMIARIAMTADQPLVLQSPQGMTRLELPISEFSRLVMYVLTTGDLVPDDPRLKLIDKIKKLVVLPGFEAIAGIRPDARRLGYPDVPKDNDAP